MATETLRPNAAGTYTNIPVQYPDSGEHWDKVDEETPDELSTYVGRSAVGASSDTYNIPDHSEGSGTINYVKVYARCKTTAGGDAYLRIAVYTHSNLYYGDEETLTLTTFSNFSKQWDTNPNTGAAWTWDEIDALEIGVELKKTGAGSPTCTQVYVEVDYTPGVTEKTSSDAGSGAEAPTVGISNHDVGYSSDRLAAKIETPTKGGGMKLWT